MHRERLEHERQRKQDADVIRDLRMSEDVTIQLLDLRAQSFNSERCRLIEELNSVSHCTPYIFGTKNFSTPLGGLIPPTFVQHPIISLITPQYLTGGVEMLLMFTLMLVVVLKLPSWTFYATAAGIIVLFLHCIGFVFQ